MITDIYFYEDGRCVLYEGNRVVKDINIFQGWVAKLREEGLVAPGTPVHLPQEENSWRISMSVQDYLEEGVKE